LGQSGFNTTINKQEWYDGTNWNVQNLFLVDAYGAVGDGVTNDGVKFQNALAACHAANGGIVQLSAKKYWISNTLTLWQGCTLHGGPQPGPGVPNDPTNWTDTNFVILLNAANVIQVCCDTGLGAEIDGVYIISQNFNFSASTLRQYIDNYHNYAGTAINATHKVFVSNSVIIGFQTCFTSATNAIAMDFVYMDCFGSTTLNITASHDTSRLSHIYIGPYGSGSVTSCPCPPGLDNERTAISAIAASPTTPLTRITLATASVYKNGDVINIFGAKPFALNKRWTAIFVDSTHVDLTGSVFGGPTGITGTVTYGKKVVSVSSMANVAVQQNISGTGIQASTTIEAVWPSQNLIWLSKPATGNATSTALTITDPAASLGSAQMVLGTYLRENTKGISCTTSELIQFLNIAVQGPDIPYYFGTGCGTPICVSCVVDSNQQMNGLIGSISTEDPTSIGVWFDSTTYSGYFQGVTTNVGRALVNTSFNSGAQSNIVVANSLLGTAFGGTASVFEHSGGNPLIITGSNTNQFQSMYIADAGGQLTLDGNNFSLAGIYAQSFNAINDVAGAGSTFGNFGEATPYFTAANSFAVTAYPQTPQVQGSILINGDMGIDQANEGAVGTACPALPLVDRWRCASNNSGAGGTVFQRVGSSPLPGYPFSLKATVGAGAATTTATVQSILVNQIEGSELRGLNWLVDQALPIVVDFCAQTNSATGNYSVALRSGTFSYTWNYNITALNTWQCFSEVIPGLLAGAGTVTTQNAIGLILDFDLGVGSNFQTSVANKWQSNACNGTNQCYEITGANQLTIVANTGKTMQWTAVHIRQGTLKNAPYVQNSYAVELDRARRFYQKSFPPLVKPAQNAGLAGSACALNPIAAGEPSLYAPFVLPLEAIPTITTYNPLAANANWRNVGAAADAAVSISSVGTIAATASFTTSSPNITMTTNPGWAIAGMRVYDTTLANNPFVGTVSTYTTTALVLTANAAVNSSGTTDSLLFSLPSMTGVNFGTVATVATIGQNLCIHWTADTGN
jgi:hypothetical protein